MNICETKLDNYNIPKIYLVDKSFSYKLYVNLCYISFWKYISDNSENRLIEYILNYYNIDHISKLVGMSRNTIIKKLKMKPYRDKLDSFDVDEMGCLNQDSKYTRNKHLMFNSPKENYSKIKRKNLEKILELNELTIRLYIFLSGYKYKTVYGLTQKDILKEIGYNNKSNRNCSELKLSTKKLKELDLIDYTVDSDGSIKFITYKIN